MPRRKRTKSSDFVTYKLPVKKRITSSTADHPDASFGSQGKLYKVRNIIDENQSKYLIDWEDDPVTGEQYTPTWVRLHTESLMYINMYIGGSVYCDRVWLFR